MQPRELKRLLDVLKDTDVSELTLETGEYKLTLRRGLGAAPAAAPVPYAAVPPAPAPAPVEQPAAQQAPEPAPSERLVDVVAPIVGTFYAAPSPDAPPFVRVGERVKPGTVLCIIEAMKLMNEIKAEVSGTVEKIYVENAQPVEYGQPLFGIRLD